MQPVSSFTSTTKALISVSSARRTSCQSFGDPNAHALTYSPLIFAVGGSSTDSWWTYRISVGRSRTLTWSAGLATWSVGLAVATALSCAKRPRLVRSAASKRTPGCRTTIIGGYTIGITERRDKRRASLHREVSRKLLNSNG